MKQKIKPKGSLIAGLDIGSSKITCFIARIIDDEGSYEIIGASNQLSQGVKNGHITDLDAVEKVLRQSVHAAENMAADIMKGYPLREIALALPSVHGRSHFHSVEMQLSGHEITDNDIRRALVEAQSKAAQDDQELIHTIPVHTVLDGQDVSDPRGMVGKDMKMDVHVISGDVTTLRNMDNAVARGHLDVSAYALGAYASALSCLVDDEMQLGALVVDIGAGITSYSVIENGAVLYAGAIPIGGGHITNDIAKGLNTPLQSAERLKILYGHAMAAQSDQKELIDVPQLGAEEGSAPNHVPRSMLVGIIQPRAEEIFEILRAELTDSGLRNPLSRSVVLTGGASQLPGLDDLARHVLDKKVRIGRPLDLAGLPDAVSGPAFSCVSGVLRYAGERTHEIPAQLKEQVRAGNLWQQLKHWFCENW